ncbi:retrovirus-related pol polyprotein from transposon TNT 1-94 [Tanacetum coccineum]|uniref:Retrovirus-related pol polyprotein from transposon TNT 1-94 n=1 Tax=Tanacetum coccineum TaxID=301880 RepID=A0ABQ5HEV1_9ASTR
MGIVIRNKARLVAQRYTQEEGIDYEEVFAPVARIEAIRLFLAYASYMGFTFYQMDVKSAFLYRTIDEDVYVIQSPGFQDLQFPDRVYKVVKAMYGLHQAPRACCAEEFETIMHDKFKYGAMGVGNSTFSSLLSVTKKDGNFLSQDKIHDWIFIVLTAIKSRYHVYCTKSYPTLGLWYPKRVSFWDLVAYSAKDYGGATIFRKSKPLVVRHVLGRRLNLLHAKMHGLLWPLLHLKLCMWQPASSVDNVLWILKSSCWTMELDMMIAELNRSNEMVAKHLSEYEQAEAELSHNEKVELINELPHVEKRFLLKSD